MNRGVAARPITDYATYRNGAIVSCRSASHEAGLRSKEQIQRYYARARTSVLRATQVVVEEALARPILIGRPAIVEARLERFGLAIRPGKDFELINPEDDPRYRTFVQAMVEAAGRKGTTPDAARTLVRTNATVIAALAVKQGIADR